MKYLSALILIAVISACTSNKSATTSTDTVVSGETLAVSKTTPRTNNTPTISSMCFVRTEGTRNLDTTTIELVTKGSTITGEMTWTPAGKDSRKGVLAGKQQDGLIDAVWTFKQEGMTDTMRVKFKLAGNNLLQKPFKVNTKNGRQETDDSADYTIAYKPSITLKR